MSARKKAWRHVPEVQGFSAGENEEKKHISEKQSTAILTGASSRTRYRDRHVSVCFWPEPAYRVGRPDSNTVIAGV